MNLILGSMALFFGFLMVTLLGYRIWRQRDIEMSQLQGRLKHLSFRDQILPSKAPRKVELTRKIALTDHHSKKSFMHLFEQKLRRSGFITVNPYQLMTITVLISLIMALLFYLIFKSDFPILASTFGGLLPGGIIWITCNQFEYKRKAKILHQMPDVLDAMNRSIRSGLGVTRAIEVAAAEIEDPLRLEFRFIADRLNVGQSLPSVFEEVAAHIDIDDFYFFAMAVIIQHETGGSLSETLTNLSNLIRRRQELRLKIKALSSEARASALIVGSLPFLASLGLSILNPEHLQPFITHSKGHTLLIIAAFMMSLGIIVIRRMIQFRM